MKLNHLFTALACVSSLSASAATHLTHFSYSARIPATASTCEVAAQTLAQQIQAAAPGVQNVQGECVTRANFKDHGEPFVVYSLRVTYDAEDQIQLSSIELPSFDYNALNAYPKYADCLKDISHQSSVFTQATGLSPLAAYCVPAYDSSYSYTLKIEAIGQATRTLQALHMIGTQSLESNSEWKKQILSFIAQSGGLVARTDGELIAYYAAPGTHIGYSAWLHTDTAEQCNAQQTEVNSMLRKLGAKNTLLVCHPDIDPASGLSVHYYLDTLYDANIEPYFSSTVDQTFFTYDECMAVRQSILDREPAAHAWAGSFCTISDFGDDRYNLKSVVRF
jgi:hypothetical protein